MGLVSYVGDKILDYRVKKLRGLLEVLEKRYQFNAYRTYVPTALTNSEKMNRALVEALVWYSGDIAALMDLFQKDATTYNEYQGMFWNVVLDTDRKVHSGLPRLIVSKMPTVIFGSGYQVECVVYNEDGTVNEEKSSVVNMAKDMLFEKLDLHNKLMQGEEKKSWSGHIAAKMSVDPSISNSLILEIYDRRYFDIYKPRGVLKYIDFKTYYETVKEKYVLRERYTTNEDGMAVIENHLYIYKNGEEKEVPLTTLDETKELEEIKVFTIKGMLALEMPNIVAQDLINGNPYGRSDIQSSSTYDALDEIMTAIVEEIRDNKTIRYIPENMIMKNSDGGFIKFNDRIKNFMKVSGDKDQNGNNTITTTVIDDKTLAHYEKYKILIANACNQSELSPLSLGITGLESITSSDASTRERSKTTLEMRNKKVILWKAFMKKLFTQLMIVNDYVSAKPLGINYDTLDINVNFNDYVGTTIEERLAIWGAGMVGGYVSVEEGVNRIYADEKSKEAKQEEINQLKIEKGIAIESPEVLDKQV